jgi:dipeptidyl-peptidase-4
VLGFDHPKVKEAYDAVKKSGRYEKVLIWDGHVGRHYAMTDHKEYFAENTEAFFGTNDIYPFVQAELKQHDPAMHALLAELWGLGGKPGDGK